MPLVERDGPVGVFDSGVGGLTVLEVLVRELPHEGFLYFADLAHVPYGARSDDEIRALVDAAVATMQGQGIKALVLACNTATSVAAESLRRRLTLPVIGMEPAVKPAVALGRPGPVLVMGTPVTLTRTKFRALVARFAGVDIRPLPCPGLVDLIEQGHVDDEELASFLRELLRPFARSEPAAVVLGCTHYSLIRGALARLLGDGVPVLDGNEGTARQTARVLAREGLARREAPEGARVRFMADGRVDRLEAAWCRYFASLPARFKSPSA